MADEVVADSQWRIRLGGGRKFIQAAVEAEFVICDGGGFVAAVADGAVADLLWRWYEVYLAGWWRGV